MTVCLGSLKNIFFAYTLKTSIPVEEGDSILKLLQSSLPEIQLGVGIHLELDYFPYIFPTRDLLARVHLLNKKPLKLLSTVMEFTFQVRSKLLSFSPRKLSTSSFILNFLECRFKQLLCPCHTFIKIIMVYEPHIETIQIFLHLFQSYSLANNFNFAL